MRTLPDRAVHAIDRDGPYVFLGGAFSRVDGVHALDARLEGVLAGGEALPDLDDQEVDPVGSWRSIRAPACPASWGANRSAHHQQRQPGGD